MEDYTRCYCAFIDILGFKRIVQSKTCSEIIGIFNELKKQYVVSKVIDEANKAPVIPPESIHYYIMSDSVCIYIDENIRQALSILTFLCMNLQVRLLCLDTPIFVRGSISKGDLYEDKGVLFGPALVEAYLRAEKLARVPRIIIPAQLIENLADKREKALLNGCTYVDYDGFYVNHYIDYFCSVNPTVAFRNNVLNYVNNVLNTSMDQSLRDKYLYVKSRMDYCLSRNDGKQTSGMGKE